MNESEALKHLVRVIGLCQVPRDQWTTEDNKTLREARGFIQEQQKKEQELESENETGSGDAPGPSGEGKDSEESTGEVPADGDTLEEGPEHPSSLDTTE